MNRYDFYNEFIKANKIKLKELFNELHSCYEVRSVTYNYVLEHKELIIASGVDIKSFTKAMSEPDSRMVFNSRARKNLPRELTKLLDSFVYLNNSKIPAIKHELIITRTLYEIPENIYFILQSSINKEIANSILRGGVYTFGKGLSKLGIRYVTRSKNAKPCPDWGASNKLKTKLISLGHEIKTKDNPSGIKWLLYRTDDGYSFWRWLKGAAFTPNKQMYKFRAIATNNECTDYQGKCTQEEILDKNIGTYDKLMALLKLNPQIISRYDF